MTDRERKIRQRLKDDFEHYAKKCLKIRPKKGSLIPLNLNGEQRFIHKKLEEQKKQTGMVRALILKGRQQGCSTYVEGRFFHRTTHSRGIRTYILTHEQQATDNLFKMVKRFYDSISPLMKPAISATNAKELIFHKLDSDYRVGTAGTKGVGRSDTVQLFHGSEVAFWPHADAHAAGIMQTVPMLPGTEIILESTANGLGNEFHQRWQDAESRISDYIAIFIPWFWNDDYIKTPADDFVLESDEIEYMEQYKLSLERMAWRRAKIIELKDPLLFKQEYPATSAEAFQQTGIDSFIPASLVMKARKMTGVEQIGPHIVGLDPARLGKDRCSLIHRQGRLAWGKESYQGKDAMEIAGICRRLLEKKPGPEYVDMIFIDIGYMPGVYDRVVEMGYGRRITPVNFGGDAYDGNRYKNKRAEIWGELKEWLEEEPPVSIPDDDALHADIIGPSYKHDSLTRLILESKQDMLARGIRSPDEGDALALTFTRPVRVVSRGASSRPNKPRLAA